MRIVRPHTLKEKIHIAEPQAAKNITEVVFDKGPYLYHGKVKALADAARDSGLKF